MKFLCYGDDVFCCGDVGSGFFLCCCLVLKNLIEICCLCCWGISEFVVIGD